MRANKTNYLLRGIAVLDTLLVGALGSMILGNVNKPASLVERARTAQVQPYNQNQAKPQEKAEVYDAKDLGELSRLREKYGFLDVYDKTIDEDVAYFSSRLGLSDLERNWIKGMIFDESGSKADRSGAFKFDPMQIANKGDYALKGLQDKIENTDLIGDFSCLEGKKNTPWRTRTVKNKKGKSSIYGGIGWMLHYKANFDTRTVEDGEVKEYEIKKGDSFDRIAKSLGTTVPTFKKYNPDAKPERLQIGQKVKYVPAREERYIAGWKTIQEAIGRYNGGGNPNYLGEVSEAKKDLDRLDELRAKCGDAELK